MRREKHWFIEPGSQDANTVIRRALPGQEITVRKNPKGKDLQVWECSDAKTKNKVVQSLSRDNCKFQIWSGFENERLKKERPEENKIQQIYRVRAHARRTHIPSVVNG